MTQPLLSSLLEKVQAESDLRRPLWGTIEALQAVARCLSHPREILPLCCQVAQLGRQALTTGAIICGLEDAAQAADDAAQQHKAAEDFHLAEGELCRAIALHRAGHPLAKVHLLSSIRALSRAIERIGERPEAIAYLADVAVRAYALGEDCAENGPEITPPPPPEAGEGTGEGAVAECVVVYDEGADRGTMNRRAA